MVSLPGVVMTHGVHLVRTDLSGASDPAGGLGEVVGLPGVLGDRGRRGSVVRVPGRAARWGFGWDEEDSRTTRWWPQGISTSADADPSGLVEGRRMLCTTWYAKSSDGVNQGSRVTLVDLGTLRYQHVHLVTASPGVDGSVGLSPLRVHAGGVVWHGDHLHVAATAQGLYSFRLSDVLRVPPGPTEASGHRYVLPARVAWSAVTADGVEPLRYSFLSLDAGASRLVGGEYGRSGRTTRLFTYALDPATSSPAVSAAGVATPGVVHDAEVARMQGVAVVDGRWFVTTSAGTYLPGSLHVGAPGRFRRRWFALPVGVEDLAAWPTEGELWSLTEYPGRRFVFSLRVADWA